MGTGHLELISNSFAFVLGIDKVFDLLKSRYLISQISNFVLILWLVSKLFSLLYGN